MQNLLKNKATLALALVLIIGMFAYNSFKVDDSALVGQSALTAGSDLLKLSEELSRADFNRTLFSASSYVFLIDFTTTIPNQTLGRSNPFQIIGRD